MKPKNRVSSFYTVPRNPRDCRDYAEDWLDFCESVMYCGVQDPKLSSLFTWAFYLKCYADRQLLERHDAE